MNRRQLIACVVLATVFAPAPVVAAPSASPVSIVRSPLPGRLVAARALVNVERGGRPLVEAVEEIARQADVPLFVDKGLARQKVTILFRKMSLADAARGLAAAVDGVWQERRIPGSPERGYWLAPSERRLERSRRYWQNRRAAEALLDERALEALVNRISGRDRRARKRGSEAAENPPIHTRPVPLYPIVQSLPASLLRQVVRYSSNAFRGTGAFGPDSTPSLVIAAADLPPTQQVLLTEFVNRLAEEYESLRGSTAAAEEARLCRQVAARPVSLLLQFWGMRHEYSDELKLGLYLRLRCPGLDWGADCNLAWVGGVPLQETRDEVTDLAPDGGQFHDETKERQEIDVSYGPARIDRALIEIARAAGVNLAADYYTKPGALPLLGSRRTLRSHLEAAEKLFSLAHFWEGTTLVVRSRDWAYADEAEPGAEVVDRWDARKARNRELVFEDYVDAAVRLTDLQISTLTNHADERGQRLYSLEVTDLARYRHVLRGYGVLNEPQRKQMRSPNGLSLGQLSTRQREGWRPVLERFALYPVKLPDGVRFRIVSAASGTGILPTFQLLTLWNGRTLDLVSR